MAQAKTTNTPIIDAYGVPELFATEMAALENLGPCYRLTFTTQQTNYKGEAELGVVVRIILPAEAVQAMAAHLPVLMRNLPLSAATNEQRANLN